MGATSQASRCRPDLDVVVAGLKGKPVSQAKVLVCQGFVIRKKTDGLVNLTEMWRAAGASPNKWPLEWLRLSTTQELASICGIDEGSDRINSAFRGGTLGTWVIPNLAVSYAKNLLPHFHAWANQAVIERMETRAMPSSIRLTLIVLPR